MFSTDDILCNLRLPSSKPNAKQYTKKTSPKSYQTEIKNLANPGLT